MRLPISLGLDWPHRVPGVGVPLDWTRAQSWTFEPLDEEAFPAVALAKRVGEAGGTAPAVFNAANEQAVHAFSAGRIGFLDILAVVQGTLDAIGASSGAVDRAGVMDADRRARETADRILAGLPLHA
jgi:1-deoxy-D-xylulose-5-phosphate reductoisomerase